MERQIRKIIEQVEGGKIKMDPDWFYHGSRFEEVKYRDILLHGLKCNALLHTRKWHQWQIFY